ncbi:hypothetical protein RV11_GL001173 [Enterococcus phoeniculicola]|jgi:putative Ca2+/H+ antiporter (TMEM165/GDT1 family)|uniref:Uncharacterized protein n=1 Tax=Enterococcus phoeniculicola ATCC BAA-412 TaxID=1158610 RepID=R3WE15_9ENTE|nr:hypothetical protein [Enterococcus phoeniculicola]EOL46101.1 hypothetical protein UC3_00907 [Enterococcus phoeniculicola ATCC BAA-412]EOT77054.1 hypothetical protein I589_02015 [Enterococcus phoeniculicola ATCC BAA-412]OJG73393.1 hypothetical protein RV11_GL001173 [Enterococcus phoeniculicola]
MTFKRFFQLFICYLLSVIVGYGVISFFPEASIWVKGLLFTVIGYIVLCLPLTILTFLKSK